MVMYGSVITLFLGGYFDKNWAPFLFFSNVYIFCFFLLLLEGTYIGGALDW